MLSHLITSFFLNWCLSYYRPKIEYAVFFKEYNFEFIYELCFECLKQNNWVQKLWEDRKLKKVTYTLFSGRGIVTCLYVSYKIVSKKIWFCRVCNKIFRKLSIILKLYIKRIMDSICHGKLFGFVVSVKWKKISINIKLYINWWLRKVDGMNLVLSCLLD